MVQPSAEPGADPFGPGAVVSIARVNQDRQVVEMLGTGRILEPLVVGERPRLQVDRRSAFTPSPLQAIEPIGTDAVRVQTKFSQYELRVVPDATVQPAPFAPQEPGAGADDRTSVVRLEGAADPSADPLGAGARVEVSRRRSAEAPYEPLGSGVLLSEPRAGQALRIATDEGVLGTSVVSAIHRLEVGVRIETANADYRIVPA